MEIDYSHLQISQKIVMIIMIVFSSLLSIPQVLFTYSKGLIFQSFLIGSAIITSCMYHLTEVNSDPLWMTENDWHRLDNLFIISSIIVFFSFLIGTSHHQFIRYSCVTVTLVILEKNPFTIFTNLLPIIIYFIVSIIIRIKERKIIKTQYNKKYFSIFLIFFALGFYFFIVGTNQAQDYLRLHHGIWHICAAIFGYFGFKSVSFTGGWSAIAQKQ